MSPDYVASDYWEHIYAAGSDESSVGYPNLARSLNRARYEVETRNVARALTAAGVRSTNRVLDVGSGTGIWIDFWRRRGVEQLVGVDLAAAAVARLRGRYPESEFLERDIGDPEAALPGGMDVVSAMSVLLHIVDDARFEGALRKLLACIRPGGVVVLVEPAIVHRWWGPPFGADASSKARPISAYLRVFSEMGFTVLDLRPASCLLINVIDTRHRLTFRLLERYWELLSRFVGRNERRGRVVGSALRAADVVASRVVSPGPSAKVLVARAGPLPRDL